MERNLFPQESYCECGHEQRIHFRGPEEEATPGSGRCHAPAGEKGAEQCACTKFVDVGARFPGTVTINGEILVGFFVLPVRTDDDYTVHHLTFDLPLKAAITISELLKAGELAGTTDGISWVKNLQK